MTLLGWVFSLYAVSSLLSMATMSIGVALLVFTIVFLTRDGRGAGAALKSYCSERTHLALLRASLALAGACALSLVAAKIWPLYFDGKTSPIHFAEDMAKDWYLFLPFLISYGFSKLTERERWVTLRSWIVAFGILSVIGVIQYFTGWPRPQLIPPGIPPRYHATIFFGHHLSTASIFIFPFFFSLDAFAVPELRRKLALPRAALGAIVAFGSVTLFFTYSRTLWVALSISLLIWVLLRLPRRTALFASGAFLVAAALMTQHPLVQRGFQRTTMSERRDLWEANLEFFKARPLTGVGFKHTLEQSANYLMKKYQTNDVFSGHAHNNFLEMLGGTGLVGAIAWLAWCGVSFWIVLRSGSSGLVCAWAAFHLNGVTQVNFWEGKVLHQMMWTLGLCLFWARVESPKISSKVAESP